MFYLCLTEPFSKDGEEHVHHDERHADSEDKVEDSAHWAVGCVHGVKIKVAWNLKA